MNWRWSKLDRFTITSHSDAHSPFKIGREACVFSEPVDYPELSRILKTKDKKKLLYTIEFFPEEGKYHWDGHRGCKSSMNPAESRRLNNICPVCGRRVTVGVASRVESLADRPEGYQDARNPGYKRVVPLAEIIADALGVSAETKSVEKEYIRIVQNFGSEFSVLLDIPEAELKTKCPPRVSKGIMNVRQGRVEIEPGYDGEYGKVKVLKESEMAAEEEKSLF
jgi:uncharacterized protein (TIGR00375 family)